MSISRSTNSHSGVPHKRDTRSSNAGASWAAYSNEVRKSNDSAEIATVVELARDRREVLQPDRDVAGGLLEQLAALVLGKCPPSLGLSDGNERRTGRFRAPETCLPGGQRLLLVPLGVAPVAGSPPQHPQRVQIT